jgi:hypothetical protein
MGGGIVKGLRVRLEVVSILVLKHGSSRGGGTIAILNRASANIT